jgi:hypothetical protein
MAVVLSIDEYAETAEKVSLGFFRGGDRRRPRESRPFRSTEQPPLRSRVRIFPPTDPRDRMGRIHRPKKKASDKSLIRRLGYTGQSGRGKSDVRQYALARPARVCSRGAGVRQKNPDRGGVAPKGLDGTIRPWRDPKPVSSGAPSSESPAEQAPEVVFQTEGRLKHS